jgi:hypothetical protein
MSDSHVFQCNICGGLHHIREAAFVGKEKLCPECFQWSKMSMFQFEDKENADYKYFIAACNS